MTAPLALPFLTTPAAADPPVVLNPDVAFLEDFETGLDGWAFEGLLGGGWSHDCTRGNPGCSLKVVPPYSAVYSKATHAMDIPMTGLTAVSFHLLVSGTDSDTDSSIHVGFNDGTSVEIHVSEGIRPNNWFRLRTATQSHTFAQWSSGNTWYMGVFLIDPTANTVKAELRTPAGALIGSSNTFSIAAGADRISYLKIDAVQWPGAATTFQYDNLRIGVATPGAPTSAAALGQVGQVRLTWTPPTTVGTAAVSQYKIYRGTSPGAETYVATVGNVNSWTDTGRPHGTTYFYRVSAVNSNGEGPLSATATATTMYFTEGWENGFNHWTQAGPGMSIDCAAGNPGCSLKVDPACCTEDQYLTVTRTLNTEIVLPTYVKFWFTSEALTGDVDTSLTVDLDQGGSATLSISEGVVPNNGVTLLSGGNGQSTFASWTPAGAWYEGVLLVDPLRNTVRAEVRDATGAVLGTSATLAIPAAASVIETVSVTGVFWGNLTTTFHYDTLSINYAHTEPRSLEAWSDGTSATLTWVAPATSVKDPVTSYRIYRGTAPGALAHVATTGNVLTYTDTGLALNTTYHYAVSGVNAAGEGYLSAEARTTTARFVEDWENGWNGWTMTGRTEASVDCATGKPGCSLRFTPTPEDVRTYVTKPVDLPMWGPTAFSFMYRSTDTVADTDTDVTLRLSGGASVRLHLSEGWRNPNNQVTLYAGTASDTFITWSANTWYRATLLFDPAGDRVKAEFRSDAGALLASSKWLAIPAAADALEGIELNAVQWTTAGPYTDFFYDSLRVYTPAVSAPPTLTVAPHNNRADLSWTAPATIDGKTVGGYRVYRSVNSGAWTTAATLGAVTAWSDTTVQNGQTACYVVVALSGSANRESLASARTCAAIAPVLATAPQSVTAVDKGLYVRVSWSAPASSGDGPVTEYCVRRWEGSNTPLNFPCVSATTLLYDDYAIVNGQWYVYEVAAKTQFGYGAWGRANTVTPQL